MSDVTIKIKRSLTPGNVPADLELGELAINIPDKKIYIGDNSTDNIALIVDGNATGGAGNPAGNNTEIQFNNNGAFGSSSLLTWEESASCGSGCTTSFLQLKDRAGIKLYEDSANGTNFISFIAPSSLTSNYGPYVLPAPTSTVNSYLALTSASNGVYTLNWVKAIVADLEGTVNRVTLTAPATAATITVGDNKTFTVNNTLSFSGTDAASVSFGAGGTVTYTSNKLSVFSATSSAELAGVISDETGSGLLVFGTSPTFTTSILTDSSSFNLLNSTATTINAFGATSSLTIGYASTNASTTNISTGATGSGRTKTVNLGTGGVLGTTNVNIGGFVGTTTVNSPQIIFGDVNGASIEGASVFSTVSLFTLTTSGVDFATSSGIINLGTSASSFVLGHNSTASSTTWIVPGFAGSGQTKTIYLGTNGAAGSTTNITIGASSGTSTITLAGDIHITGNMIVSGCIETDTGIRGNTDTEEEYLGIGMELDGGTY